MKLGVSYIVFDGVELLEHSIRQIRNQVDYIQVIYQSESWFGHPMKAEDLETMNTLKLNGLIDDLTKFSNFNPLPNKLANSIGISKSYEMAKRELGMKSALRRGCTHYLCMDVDEFYLEEEFAAAKAEIEEKGHGLTAVSFINYVNIPILNRGYDGSRVPFICRIDENTRMSSQFFVRCDPTRGIRSAVKESTCDFDPGIITMHHMETVRKDLSLKYEATTRAIFQRANTNQLINNIRAATPQNPILDFNKVIFPSLGKMILRVCENQFQIPYEEWKKPR